MTSSTSVEPDNNAATDITIREARQPVEWASTENLPVTAITHTHTASEAPPSSLNTHSGHITATGYSVTGDDAVSANIISEVDIDADLARLTVVESLCIRCERDGVTRILATDIPYFKTVAIMSFSCPHCGFSSNEVQPCSSLADKAVTITLNVGSSDGETVHADLNRQVIKSETARLLIPEIEFEMPAASSTSGGGNGTINTVEGIITNIADSLTVDQANRALSDMFLHDKLQTIIDTLYAMSRGNRPFTFVLDDLAGNCYIENPNAPHADPRVTIRRYNRTHEQEVELGFAEDDAAEETADDTADTSGVDLPALHSLSEGAIKVDPSVSEKIDTYFNVSERSAVLNGECPSCRADCPTRLCVTDIPHFKDVVLMVTDCERCGYRDTEVKPMGRVGVRATRITLNVTSVEDLARDVLKSETAAVIIPEIELELMGGTLGSKYTTLEGLLSDIKNQLTNINQFSTGDSARNESKSEMSKFLESFQQLIDCQRCWTFILDDPLSNCFIFHSGDDQSSGKVLVEQYERTHEQNEELGLNDINVDHYLDEDEEKLLEEEMKKDGNTTDNVSGSSSSSVTTTSVSVSDGVDVVVAAMSKVGGTIRQQDVDNL